MNRRVLSLSAALIALPAALAAQPLPSPSQGPDPVDEVVVTASRLNASARLSPYTVATLPGAAIAGQASLAGALSGTGDIYVQAPGGRSGNSSVFLRGADPNFTVVLLDGVPLNNSTNSRGGAVNVSEIDPANLERVELVTGPLSSLYGSGSLAGAINLVVPGGTDTAQGRVTVGAGSRGFRAGSALAQGPLAAGLGGSIGVTLDDDGHPVAGSSFNSSAVTVKIAPLGQEDSGRLILRAMRTKAEGFPDSSGGPRYATRRGLDVRDGREKLAGLSVPVIKTDDLRLDLSANYLDRRDKTASVGVAPSAFDPQGVPAGTDDSRYKRASAQAVARFSLAGWDAAVGGEALREKGDSTGVLDFGGFKAPNSFAQDRDTYSGFVEANRESGGWTFNTGARVDDVDGLGSRVTARGGVRYAVADSGLSFRANVGSGFKAPSFYALGNPFVGNRDLGPERSVGGEAGTAWTDGATTAALTLFRTEFKGLIDFVPDPAPHLENRDLVISKGVSASVRHVFSAGLSGGVQVDYATTTDDESGEQLLNRPKWRVSSNLTWTPTPALSFAMRHSYVGRRGDYATPTGQRTLAAYNAVSLEAAWRVAPKTTARLVVDNALDETWEDATGFRAPASSARLYLTHEF